MKITDRYPLLSVLSLGHSILAVLCGLLMITGIYFFHSIYRTSEEKRQNEVHAQQLDAKIKAILLEQKEWQKIRPTYEKMQQLALFSPEKRLVWIETIQQLVTHLGGHELQYTLKPKKKIRLPSTIIKIPKKTNLYASQMRITFLAPHEETFIHFVQALRSKHIGYFIMKEYQIHRTENRYLQIQLLLEWLSFYDDKQDKPEKQTETIGEQQDE